MTKNSTQFVALILCNLLLAGCAWFHKDTGDNNLVKPTPVGGYEALSARIYYPRHVRDLGVEGTVEVRTHVSMEGEVIETSIGTSLHPDLDRIVSNAVKRTRFTPATRGGVPVDIWISIPFVFALQDWQDKQSPFSRFEMVIYPDPAYQHYQVEMKGRLAGNNKTPVRFECLLPVNYERPWAKTGSGQILQTGLARDEYGEWMIFDLEESQVNFGFHYRPIYNQQTDAKLQYSFALNHKLPEWTLAVIYDAQKVVFKHEPDQITELPDGGYKYVYEMQRLDAYETRYLEISLEQ